MEHLLHTPSAVPPVLTYLFHRIEQRLTGAPTLLILDEAWVYLDHPLFAARIREWLKVLRKLNASVVFATQSLADAADSTIAAAISESCLTRIFLPNARAIEDQVAEYYQRYGLNDRQLHLLASATPRRQYYHQGRQGNRLFELEIRPVARAFCAAGSKEDLRRIQALCREDPENFPRRWLEEKGLPWATDLLTATRAPAAARQAGRRQRRQAQPAGRRLTAPTRAVAGGLLVLTPREAATWSAAEVLALSRARWQVALVCKRRTQLLRLNQIRSTPLSSGEATGRALLLAWALHAETVVPRRALLPTGTLRDATPVRRGRLTGRGLDT